MTEGVRMPQMGIVWTQTSQVTIDMTRLPALCWYVRATVTIGFLLSELLLSRCLTYFLLELQVC